MGKVRIIVKQPPHGLGVAQKTTVGGVTFDSKREANRWVALRLMQRAGLIRDLERQVKFPLDAPIGCGLSAAVGHYVADFTYTVVQAGGGLTAGQQVVEDVKGVWTPLYRWKARHFALQYGFRILEV